MSNTHPSPREAHAQLVGAIARGTHRAAMRLDELGTHPLAGAAYVSNEWSMTDEARRALTAEGARVTAAATDQLRVDDDLPALLTLVEELTANPWHDGPTRHNVMRDINVRLAANHGLPAVAEIQRDDDYISLADSGRVERATEFIAEANDRDMVNAITATIAQEEGLQTSQPQRVAETALESSLADEAGPAAGHVEDVARHGSITIYTDVTGRTQRAVTGPNGHFLVTSKSDRYPFEVWRSDSLDTIARTNNPARALEIACAAAGIETFDATDAGDAHVAQEEERSRASQPQHDPSVAAGARLHDLVYGPMGVPGAGAGRRASASPATTPAPARRAPVASVEL